MPNMPTNLPTYIYSVFSCTKLTMYNHGCVKSTAIERRQHQLGRMADISPPVTFSVFDL